MKAPADEKGSVYRCPVCGAEISVLAGRHGVFEPVCCNVRMIKLSRRLVIYRCPVCDAEIGIVAASCGDFNPSCCNVKMLAA